MILSSVESGGKSSRFGYDGYASLGWFLLPQETIAFGDGWLIGVIDSMVINGIIISSNGYIHGY